MGTPMFKSTKLTDSDWMPFGKHKGVRLRNVPDSYLLYLYNNGISDGNVKDYIEENLDAIKKNVNG